MWNVLGRILKSDLYYFTGRSMKSDALLRRAVAADDECYRAAERLYSRGIDDEPLLALGLRSLLAVQNSSGRDSEARRFFTTVMERRDVSHAQLFQDLFVLLATGDKRTGYFVEIGVGDGLALSNTALLERNYGWTGILAEPNPAFHAAIRASRSAVLDTRAVYSRSGATLDFLCDGARELSGIVETHTRKQQKTGGRIIPVETISVNDLLDFHKAPAVIDYMSIDTEGSELAIISGLDFTRYRPRVLTLEHNNHASRLAKFKQLLEPKGYRYVLPRFSQFDAWFVDGSQQLGDGIAYL